jgi:hypothetical protein
MDRICAVDPGQGKALSVDLQNLFNALDPASDARVVGQVKTALPGHPRIGNQGHVGEADMIANQKG